MINCAHATLQAIRQPDRQRPITWHSRYNGFSAIALVDGKAIAGISGPWSEKYALTWWDQEEPSLDLFESQDDAQRAVEKRLQTLRDRQRRSNRSPVGVRALVTVASS